MKLKTDSKLPKDLAEFLEEAKDYADFGWANPDDQERLGVKLYGELNQFFLLGDDALPFVKTGEVIKFLEEKPQQAIIEKVNEFYGLAKRGKDYSTRPITPKNIQKRFDQWSETKNKLVADLSQKCEVDSQRQSERCGAQWVDRSSDEAVLVEHPPKVDVLPKGQESSDDASEEGDHPKAKME